MATCNQITASRNTDSFGQGAKLEDIAAGRRASAFSGLQLSTANTVSGFPTERDEVDTNRYEQGDSWTDDMTVVKTTSPPSYRLVYTANKQEEVVASIQLVLTCIKGLPPFKAKTM